MNHWNGDRLGYQAIGVAFTNLIKSLDEAKVISIEAGFGRGKTFFRRAWSKHLREAGEVVVEVDVQQSDHSGDPVVTLLGALVEALPESNKSKSTEAIESAKKLGALGAKTVARAVLRAGADEVIDELSNAAIDKLGDFDKLDDLIKEFGEGMSKAAGQFIAAQMAAERVRTQELPEQLEILQAALCQDSDSNNVVVIIDELDRCHPDYAIAVLEALKIVFHQQNFIFCLMINADYLEKLAQHRFGVSTDDEKYLDKFVDIRLALKPKDEHFQAAVKSIANELPLAIPFGNSAQFSVGKAAELASELALLSNLSLRKVKRILLKVEMALRCYANQPLDAPLLVFLAFKNEIGTAARFDLLPRANLTPDEGASWIDRLNRESDMSFDANNTRTAQLMRDKIREMGREIAELPRERYRLPDDGQNYYDWAKVFAHLANFYIPDHQSILDAVAEIVVAEG